VPEFSNIYFLPVISENLAADIVGHEKLRFTYGLYSSGATLELQRTSLEKVG